MNEATKDLKLIHYTLRPVKEMYHAPQSRPPLYKPKGLWVSAEGYGDTWLDYLVSAGQLRDGLLMQEVLLSPDANILRIRTTEEFDAFETDYVARQKHFRIYGLISWLSVARSCQGIVIAPWIDDRRWGSTPSGLRGGWYWGWDCACGCIWDPEAVESIGPPEPLSGRLQQAAAGGA